MGGSREEMRPGGGGREETGPVPWLVVKLLKQQSSAGQSLIKREKRSALEATTKLSFGRLVITVTSEKIRPN